MNKKTRNQVKKNEADLPDVVDFQRQSKDNTNLWGTIRDIVKIQRQAPPLKSVSRDRTLLLSFAQRRLWFLNQLDPNNSANNISIRLRINGSLDVTALQKAISEIIDRHEVFRTSFSVYEGEPVQVITKTLPLQLSIVDISKFSEVEREIELRRLVTEEGRRPFDLSRCPILRVHLFKLDLEEHAFLLTTHHIICDVVSKKVLIDELLTLYKSFSSGELSPLQNLPIQYADFAIWERQWLQGEVLESQLSYWRQALKAAPPLLKLPTDRPRPSVQRFSGKTQTFVIDKSLSDALKALSNQNGVTLFLVLLTAFKTLIYRYAEQEDIIIGTPVFNRNRNETKNLIGLFAKDIVLRTSMAGNPSFEELLQRVKLVFQEAYAHQDAPLEKLVEELQTERDHSYNPLFQVVFSFFSNQFPLKQLPNLTLSSLDGDRNVSYFDLSLTITMDTLNNKEQGLWGAFTFKKDLFNEDTIIRMADHFQTLLDSIVTDPTQCISNLTFVTEKEKRQILAEWSGSSSKMSYIEDQCLHQLFEAQAERTPDAISVVFEDKRITYQTLNSRANQVAHTLRKQGVGPGVIVGLVMERSLEMVVGLLGILKAGGTYVPFDPSYPEERLSYIMEDAHISILLKQNQQTFPEQLAKTICMDSDWPTIAKESTENPVGEITSKNIAYVIYTSGSTGKPKGVLVSHYNVVRLFYATHHWFDFNENDVWSLFHSHAFDLSVWEVWGALLYGGCFVVIPYWMSRSPDIFYKLLCREQVTILTQTPSAFRQLVQVDRSLDTARSKSLRSVIFGGETLDFQSLNPWFDLHGDKSPQLVNMYGTTETTVHVTYHPLTIDDLSEAPKSIIGRPIPDLTVYVLDRYLQPVPPGVLGELYIGGAGLSQGYLNRSDLSAERFIPDPFSIKEGMRLYKSGDLVRYLPNGDIEYYGRNDHQVQIRGYRIELGEIETVIEKHPAVQESTVLTREYAPGDIRLISYIVPDRQRAFTVRKLIQFEKEGRLAEHSQYELSNGLPVFHLSNSKETDFLYREIFKEQIYTKNGITLREGNCIFDVGSNIGLFTLLVNRMCKNPEIYAFEPIPPIFEVLQLNTTLYGLKTKLFAYGLGSPEKDSDTFTYYPYFSTLSGRFADDMEAREVVKAMMRNEQPVDEGETAVPDEVLLDELLTAKLVNQVFTCKLKTISDVINENDIEQIDLLKIDVEKSELDVLVGIDENDWPKIRQIVVEVHTDSLVDSITALFGHHGYDTVVEQTITQKDTGAHTIYALQLSGNHRSTDEANNKPDHMIKPTWSSPKPLLNEVRHFLSEKLPDYMLPSVFMLLDAMPLTPNGKIDHSALPEPDANLPILESTFVAPRTPVEEKLAEIWQDLIGIDRVSIYDNFFELGGHSLLIIQLATFIQEAFHTELPLRTLFDSPTIEEMTKVILARQIKQEGKSEATDLLRNLKQLSSDDVKALLEAETGKRMKG